MRPSWKRGSKRCNARCLGESMIAKVYKFGLLPPIKNGEIVEEQMRKGHLYHNECIRIENDRRVQVREVGSLANADIARLEIQEEEIKGRLTSLREEVGKAHSANRSKDTCAAHKHEAAKLKLRLKECRAELKAHRAALKNDLRAKELYATAAASATQRGKDTNRAYKDAVTWGTRGLKNEAVKAAADKQPLFADIHFKRWNGCGKIGVQIQTRSGDEPTSIDEVFAGKCRLIQIDPVDRAAFYAPRGERKKLTRTRLRIRVGSDKSKKPIWAEFPMILHREIPPGSIITGATVSRTMHGPRAEWTAELTLKMKEQPRRDVSGHVAIDIGWRDTGSLRVATWVGSDGASGKIELSESVLGGLDKVDSLKGIRSTNFDEAIEYLRAWIKLGKASEWLVENTQTIHAWKSIGRLAALVRRWEENRFDGDEDIYDRLEKWRYNDYHLWAWECGQRRSTLRQRKDYYRNVAAQLARKYEFVVLEDFNLAKVAKRPELHENEDDNETARANRHSASVSEFRLCLENAFGKDRVKRVNPANTSKMCHACKSIQAIGSALTHKCTECGAEYDRDENAAKNILSLGETSVVKLKEVKKRNMGRKKPRERGGDAEIPGPLAPHRTSSFRVSSSKLAL